MKSTQEAKTTPPQKAYSWPVRMLIFGALAGAVWWVLHPIRTVLYTLFLSFLVAYVMDPIMDWAEERKVPRTVSALLFLFVALCVVTGFTLWIIPPLYQELQRATEALAGLSDSWLPGALATLENFTGITLDNSLALIQQKAKEYGPALLREVGSWMGTGAKSTLSAFSSLIYVATMPLFIFYFARDFDRITGWLERQLPLAKRDFIVTRVRSADQVIGQWLRGQAQVALILAGVYAIGLSLTGIPLALPIGLLAGGLSVIPYLGGAIGFLLALMMALLTLDGGLSALWVGVVFALASLLEGYILTPKIVGEKVGLSPVVVLIVLLIGGEAFGIFGILIAVPIAGVVKVFGSEALQWYRSSSHYTGTAEGSSEES